MTLASTDPKPSSPSKQVALPFSMISMLLAIPDAYAFVNGIEILSMPTNLYYTASESNGVDYVGNEVNYRIENMTAMEMVYRINVGGSAHSFDQDTGMYRNWDSVVDEQKYLDDLSSRWTVLPQNVSLQLNFVQIPEYSAPQASL
ncbi:hypothetical protein L3X38_020037 [Prunus dulcis]|uniref:Uncharacterized protein n=1 Tax=Prunus dulcis TaxID=3755 RepID=A0AAD4ZD41_PRUDU|nr:hypothetical protein L3X38_020037 [Prunus dulcis]